MNPTDFVGVSLTAWLLEVAVLLKTAAPLMLKSKRFCSCAEAMYVSAKSVMTSPAVLISAFPSETDVSGRPLKSAQGKPFPPNSIEIFIKRARSLVQTHSFSLLHRWNATQLADHRFRHFAIDMHDCDRGMRNARLGLTTAAEGEVCDVDAMFPENRAHLANHSGHVLVAHVNQVLLEWRLNINSIHVQQARGVLPKYGALHDVFFFWRRDRNLEHASRTTGGSFWLALFAHRQSAL